MIRSPTNSISNRYLAAISRSSEDNDNVESSILSSPQLSPPRRYRSSEHSTDSGLYSPPTKTHSNRLSSTNSTPAITASTSESLSMTASAKSQISNQTPATAAATTFSSSSASIDTLSTPLRSSQSTNSQGIYSAVISSSLRDSSRSGDDEGRIIEDRSVSPDSEENQKHFTPPRQEHDSQNSALRQEGVQGYTAANTIDDAGVAASNSSLQASPMQEQHLKLQQLRQRWQYQQQSRPQNPQQQQSPPPNNNLPQGMDNLARAVAERREARAALAEKWLKKNKEPPSLRRQWSDPTASFEMHAKQSATPVENSNNQLGKTDQEYSVVSPSKIISLFESESKMRPRSTSLGGSPLTYLSKPSVRQEDLETNHNDSTRKAPARVSSNGKFVRGMFPPVPRPIHKKDTSNSHEMLWGDKNAQASHNKDGPFGGRENSLASGFDAIAERGGLAIRSADLRQQMTALSLCWDSPEAHRTDNSKHKTRRYFFPDDDEASNIEGVLRKHTSLVQIPGFVTNQSLLSETSSSEDNGNSAERIESPLNGREKNVPPNQMDQINEPRSNAFESRKLINESNSFASIRSRLRAVSHPSMTMDEASKETSAGGTGASPEDGTEGSSTFRKPVEHTTTLNQQEQGDLQSTVSSKSQQNSVHRRISADSKSQPESPSDEKETKSTPSVERELDKNAKTENGGEDLSVHNSDKSTKILSPITQPQTADGVDEQNRAGKLTNERTGFKRNKLRKVWPPNKINEQDKSEPSRADDTTFQTSRHFFAETPNSAARSVNRRNQQWAPSDLKTDEKNPRATWKRNMISEPVFEGDEARETGSKMDSKLRANEYANRHHTNITAHANVSATEDRQLRMHRRNRLIDANILENEAVNIPVPTHLNLNDNLDSHSFEGPSVVDDVSDVSSLTFTLASKTVPSKGHVDLDHSGGNKAVTFTSVKDRISAFGGGGVERNKFISFSKRKSKYRPTQEKKTESTCPEQTKSSFGDLRHRSENGQLSSEEQKAGDSPDSPSIDTNTVSQKNSSRSRISSKLSGESFNHLPQSAERCSNNSAPMTSDDPPIGTSLLSSDIVSSMKKIKDSADCDVPIKGEDQLSKEFKPEVALGDAKPSDDRIAVSFDAEKSPDTPSKENTPPCDLSPTLEVSHKDDLLKTRTRQDRVTLLQSTHEKYVGDEPKSLSRKHHEAQFVQSDSSTLLKPEVCQYPEDNESIKKSGTKVQATTAKTKTNTSQDQPNSATIVANKLKNEGEKSTFYSTAEIRRVQSRVQSFLMSKNEKIQLGSHKTFSTHRKEEPGTKGNIGVEPKYGASNNVFWASEERKTQSYAQFVPSGQKNPGVANGSEPDRLNDGKFDGAVKQPNWLGGLDSKDTFQSQTEAKKEIPEESENTSRPSIKDRIKAFEFEESPVKRDEGTSLPSNTLEASTNQLEAETSIVSGSMMETKDSATNAVQNSEQSFRAVAGSVKKDVVKSQHPEKPPPKRISKLTGLFRGGTPPLIARAHTERTKEPQSPVQQLNRDDHKHVFSPRLLSLGRTGSMRGDSKTALDDIDSDNVIILSPGNSTVSGLTISTCLGGMSASESSGDENNLGKEKRSQERPSSETSEAPAAHLIQSALDGDREKKSSKGVSEPSSSQTSEARLNHSHSVGMQGLSEESTKSKVSKQSMWKLDSTSLLPRGKVGSDGKNTFSSVPPSDENVTKTSSACPQDTNKKVLEAESKRKTANPQNNRPLSRREVINQRALVLPPSWGKSNRVDRNETKKTVTNMSTPKRPPIRSAPTTPIRYVSGQGVVASPSTPRRPSPVLPRQKSPSVIGASPDRGVGAAKTLTHSPSPRRTSVDSDRPSDRRSKLQMARVGNRFKSSSRSPSNLDNPSSTTKPREEKKVLPKEHTESPTRRSSLAAVRVREARRSRETSPNQVQHSQEINWESSPATNARVQRTAGRVLSERKARMAKRGSPVVPSDRRQDSECELLGEKRMPTMVGQDLTAAENGRSPKKSSSPSRRETLSKAVALRRGRIIGQTSSASSG